KLSYSEAKVSLIVSDLENRGLVEKFKKGRGNIIIIPDDRR
ncbi:MAG: helix-turn-helix transcriptional regulator, partial [Halobacteriota archaeon]